MKLHLFQSQDITEDTDMSVERSWLYTNHGKMVSCHLALSSEADSLVRISFFPLILWGPCRSLKTHSLALDLRLSSTLKMELNRLRSLLVS